jgi:hypothetical protein
MANTSAVPNSNRRQHHVSSPIKDRIRLISSAIYNRFLISWKNSLSEPNQRRTIEVICRRVKSLLVPVPAQEAKVEAYSEILQQNQGELEDFLCGCLDEESSLPQPVKDKQASTNSHRRISDIVLLPSSTEETEDGIRRVLDLLDEDNDDYSHSEEEEEEEDEDEDGDVRMSRRRPRQLE